MSGRKTQARTRSYYPTPSYLYRKPGNQYLGQSTLSHCISPSRMWDLISPTATHRCPNLVATTSLYGHLHYWRIYLPLMNVHCRTEIGKQNAPYTQLHAQVRQSCLSDWRAKFLQVSRFSEVQTRARVCAIPPLSDTLGAYREPTGTNDLQTTHKLLCFWPSTDNRKWRPSHGRGNHEYTDFSRLEPQPLAQPSNLRQGQRGSVTHQKGRDAGNAHPVSSMTLYRTSGRDCVPVERFCLR